MQQLASLQPAAALLQQSPSSSSAVRGAPPPSRRGGAAGAAATLLSWGCSASLGAPAATPPLEAARGNSSRSPGARSNPPSRSPGARSKPVAPPSRSLGARVCTGASRSTHACVCTLLARPVLSPNRPFLTAGPPGRQGEWQHPLAARRRSRQLSTCTASAGRPTPDIRPLAPFETAGSAGATGSAPAERPAGDVHRVGRRRDAHARGGLLSALSAPPPAFPRPLSPRRASPPRHLLGVDAEEPREPRPVQPLPPHPPLAVHPPHTRPAPARQPAAHRPLSRVAGHCRASPLALEAAPAASARATPSGPPARAASRHGRVPPSRPGAAALVMQRPFDGGRPTRPWRGGPPWRQARPDIRHLSAG